MNTIEQLTEILISQKQVCFFFLSPEGKASVKVRECEEYDYFEYDLEYKEGDMFEIGPTKSSDNIIDTKLSFQNMKEAGNTVLQYRAKKLGVSWKEGL